MEFYRIFTATVRLVLTTTRVPGRQRSVVFRAIYFVGGSRRNRNYRPSACTHMGDRQSSRNVCRAGDALLPERTRRAVIQTRARTGPAELGLRVKRSAPLCPDSVAARDVNFHILHGAYVYTARYGRVI